jgi:hypothetical protein
MDYSKEWQGYRNARTLLFSLWLGYIPGVFVVHWIISKRMPSLAVGSSMVVALLWMAAFAASGIRFNSWPCPRCKNRFAGTNLYTYSYFARKCVHCGLAKFALHGEKADLYGN